MLATYPAATEFRGGYLQTEYAQLAHVSDRTIRNWVRQGVGPAPIARDAGRLLFDRAEVAAFLIARGGQ